VYNYDKRERERDRKERTILKEAQKRKRFLRHKTRIDLMDNTKK
jgi:hypothetical protein